MAQKAGRAFLITHNLRQLWHGLLTIKIHKIMGINERYNVKEQYKKETGFDCGSAEEWSAGYVEWLEDKLAEVNKSAIGGVMPSLFTDKEIWEWWETQKFQKEDGEQEYKMLFECDLPKILRAFATQFLN